MVTFYNCWQAKSTHLLRSSPPQRHTWLTWLLNNVLHCQALLHLELESTLGYSDTVRYHQCLMLNAFLRGFVMKCCDLPPRFQLVISWVSQSGLWFLPQTEPEPKIRTQNQNWLSRKPGLQSGCGFFKAPLREPGHARTNHNTMQLVRLDLVACHNV